MKEPALKPEALGPAGSALGAEADAASVQRLLLDMLKDRARRFSEKLEAAFAKESAKGATFDEALNKVMVLAFKAADCHTFYILARNNLQVVSQLPASPMRDALLRLYELMGLQLVYENAGDFLGLLPDTDHMLARINRLLGEIRPDAVALTDGFGITDWNLKSTLGRYDGKIYEAIYEEAKLSPLNQSAKMIGWEKFAQVLDLDFIRKGMQEQRQGEAATASKL